MMRSREGSAGKVVSTTPNAEKTLTTDCSYYLLPRARDNVWCFVYAAALSLLCYLTVSDPALLLGRWENGLPRDHAMDDIWPQKLMDAKLR